MLLGRPEDFHYACQLLLFILAREDWITSQELREDTAQGPHVNGHTIGHTKDYFWRSVEARLDVCVDLLILHAAGAKVDDLDLRASGMGEEDVLGLQVAVDDFVAFEKHQTTEKLFGKASDELQREASKFVAFDEFIEIHP